MPPLTASLVIVLTLGTIESLAHWWMHPPTNKSPTLILTYTPPSQSTNRVEQSSLRDPSQISNFKSQIPNRAAQNPSQDPSPISNLQSSAAQPQPLPEIYHQAAPTLRCSTGQVFRLDLSESAHLHFAYFEWNDTDTGSVLEAFRHMPEVCMGSTGFHLVSKEVPITYHVQDTPLIFDHTIFREPSDSDSDPNSFAITQPHVHAFRAVWVAGLPGSNARVGIQGNSFDQLRTIRFNTALHRFRPSHARVVQGTVRGIHDPHLAWQAFEKAILQDLTFVQSPAPAASPQPALD